METSANNLILVGHGVQADIQRLEEMKISTFSLSLHFPLTSVDPTELPQNVLVIDTTALERTLSGSPPPPSSTKRAPAPRPTLAALLSALGIQPACLLNNAGNDAFMGLYAFQRMIDPESATIAVPTTRMHMGAPMPVRPALSPRPTGIAGMGMGIGGMYAPPSLLHVPSGGAGTMRAMGGVHRASGFDAGEMNARGAPPVPSPISPLMLPAADITGRERGGGANKLGRRATEKGASGSSSGSGTQTSTSTSTSTSEDTGT